MNCASCGGYVERSMVHCPHCGAVLARVMLGEDQSLRPRSDTHQIPPYATPPQTPYPLDRMRGRRISQRDTNIIVVGVVIAIVVVFVFAVSIWYLIANIEPEPMHDDITVNLASPSVQQLFRGGTTCWDAVLNINKITPKDVRVAWESLFVVVFSSEGWALNPALQPRPDLNDYDDGADGNIDVEFWYVETGGDTHLGAGDAFKITGTSLDYEGATILLEFRGNRIGSVTLPTNFP